MVRKGENRLGNREINCEVVAGFDFGVLFRVVGIRAAASAARFKELSATSKYRVC